eukprot:scaffold1747_cov108-Isochrysis_galbana.AAC.7
MGSAWRLAPLLLGDFCRELSGEVERKEARAPRPRSLFACPRRSPALAPLHFTTEEPHARLPLRLATGQRLRPPLRRNYPHRALPIGHRERHLPGVEPLGVAPPAELPADHVHVILAQHAVPVGVKTVDERLQQELHRLYQRHVSALEGGAVGQAGLHPGGVRSLGNHRGRPLADRLTVVRRQPRTGRERLRQCQPAQRLAEAIKREVQHGAAALELVGHKRLGVDKRQCALSFSQRRVMQLRVRQKQHPLGEIDALVVGLRVGHNRRKPLLGLI